MEKLMLKGRIVLMLLVPLVAVSACDDDDDDDIDIDVLTDQEFVNRAAANNLFEINSSQLALTNSATDTVVSFANKMIADHITASDQLETLAGNKNLTIPTTLPQEKQHILDSLEVQTGLPFDEDYMEAQVEAHEEAVSLFEVASEDLDDEELRAFAKDMLPTLREHLKMAEDIEDMVDDL